MKTCICISCQRSFEVSGRSRPRCIECCVKQTGARQRGAASRFMEDVNYIKSHAAGRMKEILAHHSLRTREEVGQQLGITAEAVRRIEIRALAKLFRLCSRTDEERKCEV